MVMRGAQLLAAAHLAALLAGVRGGPPSARFAVLDPAAFAHYLSFGEGDGGGALDENDWAQANIPYFESDSEDFNVAYYFRWHMFHSHMNASGWHDADGTPKYLITEFTGVAATHSGSAAHHIMEARWLRDPAPVKDYVEYWANGASRAYTYWYSHAAFEAYKVLAPSDSAAWLAALYEPLKGLYEQSFITSPHLVAGNGENGMNPGQRCFFKLAGWDAEENSISGDGCRPLSNACALGEALGMARIAAVVNGSETEAKRWLNYSNIYRSALTDVLWNEELETFSVLNVPKPGCNSTPGSHSPCFPGGSQPVKNLTLSCTSSSYSEEVCDAIGRTDPIHAKACGQVRWPPNTLTQVREMHALSTPWMLGAFDNDRANAAKYARAWRALNDPNGFDAAWGPRTAERRHACYNFTRWSPIVGPDGRGGRHDDNWNGPSWPFETSKMLTGYSNLLNDFPPAVAQAGNVSVENFALWLRRYVYQHTRGGVINGSVELGQNGTAPWIGENFHPDDGYWLSRYLRFQQNCSAASGPPGPGGGKPGCNMDELYNHSSFIDLIISAMIGLRAAAGALLTINPLVASTTRYFAIDSLRYRGNDLAVAFDRDGTGRYSQKGCAKGLCLWVDGQMVASRSTLGKLQHQLPRIN